MSERKKYLFLIPRLGGGGAERVMATIANGLCSKSDIKIVTLTTNESFYKLDERVQVSGIGCVVNRDNKVTLLFSEIIGFLKSIYKLANVIKQYNPDAILSFLTDTNTIAVLLKVFFRLKCQVVVSERADPNRRGAVTRCIERYFYPKVDTIVCQSSQVAKFFREKDQEKIVIIPNPISSDAIPEVWDGERKKIIVGIGRLFPQKNFSLLIDAFKNLDDDFSDYKLEIYGDGYLKEKLVEQINKLDLSDRVFLMGMKENVMHHIADVSLFVLSSDFEGFPNALVEAMATGLPVISTDFTPHGVASEIVGKKNGIVVPTNDVYSMTEAIQKILRDKEKQHAMSIENRKILERLSEDKINCIWKSVLDK